MVCKGGKDAFMSACPETWVVIILSGIFVSYAGLYIFVIRPNSERIVKRFLKSLKVKNPDKMALAGKQFLPLIWFLSFTAMAWMVVKIWGIENSPFVEGSAGFGALTVFILVVIQKTIYPSGGVHGPEVLMLDMFDEGNYIRAEDPKGFQGPYEGWVRDVNLHGTTIVTPKLEIMTIPNKVLVEMIVYNMDRSPFHFKTIPIEGEIDITQVKGITTGLIATMTTKDENWYNRIFKTAAADGISNQAVPVRVVYNGKGPMLYLPVRNQKDGTAALHELISKNIITVRAT